MEYEHQYASNAKGNLGVTLGAIGTGLSALGGTGILGNLFGGSGSNQYVTKEVYNVQLDLIEANKKNAILESNLNTETKIVSAFQASVDRENKIRDELNDKIIALDKKVTDNIAGQSVINCQMSSQIALNTSQIGQLFNMTKLVIPSANVCSGSTGTTTT